MMSLPPFLELGPEILGPYLPHTSVHQIESSEKTSHHTV